MKIKTIALFLLLATGLTGCSAVRALVAEKEFTNADDHFSVKFPGGSADVETERGKTKNKYVGSDGTMYSKNFDNHSDNYRSYEVNVFDVKTLPPQLGVSQRTILSFGLNGWDDEPGSVTKDVTINGMPGLECLRTVAIGPASMTFREVVFWSEKDKLLYVLRVAAVKKENVNAKEADEFVNSFHIV